MRTAVEPDENAGGMLPLSSARPGIASPGFVVALVGPDGVGKSAQAARLTALFQEQHKCVAIYLGSGDGGWKWRQLAQQYYRKCRRRFGQATAAPLAPGRTLSTNHSVFTGLIGLVIAIERYVTLRRAIRLASSGFIVISDRWPQNLQPGLFDGPLRVHPRASWVARRLGSIEQRLYCRMEAYSPELTIHFVSDFETSSARKPGDRNRTDFELRLSIMQELRSLDPAIRTVDARNGFDEVTRELSHLISHALSERTRRCALSATVEPGH